MKKIYEWASCPYNWLIAAWCAAIAYLASYNRGPLNDIIGGLLIALHQPCMLFWPICQMFIYVGVTAIDWVRKWFAGEKKVDLETLRDTAIGAVSEVLEEVGK